MTRPLESHRPGPAEQGRTTTSEGCFRGDVAHAAEAQSLWNALARARADYAPRVLAAAEDAVFRWYLPLARAHVSGPTLTAVDPIAVQQAAELGLAQAVLGWRQPDCHEFGRFAGIMITERVDRCVAESGHRRPLSLPSANFPLAGRRDSPHRPGPGTARAAVATE